MALRGIEEAGDAGFSVMGVVVDMVCVAPAYFVDFRPKPAGETPALRITLHEL